MVGKSKRRGGMLKNIAAPLGRASSTLGKEYGKDYLQKKAPKVSIGIYENPELMKDPKFMMSGLKSYPTKGQNFAYGKENYPNVNYPNVNYPNVNYPNVNYPNVNYPNVNYNDTKETIGGKTKKRRYKKKGKTKRNRK
jgi:hypothetical protein